MKHLFAAMAAGLLSVAAVPTAQAYVGDWYYNDVRDGWEILELGDSSDGTVRVLRGTGAYCERPGVPYARIRQVLRRNGTSGQQISWWEDANCGSHVRICVENLRGETACSTYQDQGWQ